MTAPRAHGPWSLVGRASEMAQVAAARADAACPGAVTIAPAGVGKSRLAREACTAAQADGAVTLWAQATVCSAVIPLGALAGLIPGEVRSDDTLELLRRSTAALRAQAGDRTGLARSLEDIAWSAERLGRAADAAWLLGQAEALREHTGVSHSADDRLEYDEVVARLGAELGPDTLTALRSAGRDATVREVLARIDEWRERESPRARSG